MCLLLKYSFLIGLFALLVSTVSCGGGHSRQPAAEAITAYLQALVQNDIHAMINLSCAQWESQAKLELDSFAAVKVALEGPGCTESGTDDGIVLVNCSGKIIANYGAEDLVIELRERTYQVVNEGGEWRMCGYR